MSSPLRRTAASLVDGSRGILAADESPRTMSQRLERAGVPPTEEMRRAYREMLVTTPGLSSWVSGVILCDETAGQRTSAGVPFPQACRELGVLPGVKVDLGTTALPGTAGEVVTEGLDGLGARMAGYAAAGAAFTKWRAVLHIDAQRPSEAARAANAHALARYAGLAQEHGLVPIVEPELLMDGDHTLQRCAQATTDTLREVFAELARFGVDPAGIILKPSMVLPGRDCPQPASTTEVAEATVAVLRACVPAAVPGIAFLSGGQPPEVATAHLAAMTALGPHPWALTFSYGRALVDPALAAWRGDPARVADGQQALAERARANSEARTPTLAAAVGS